VARAAKAKAVERLTLLAAADDAPAATIASMGTISANAGDHSAAVNYYRRALAKDYGQFGWRMGLARSLVQTGDLAAALQEARVCLRFRPQDAGVRQLIQEISLNPGVTADASNKP
jgi:Tfp pilus assembly protein PilF